MSPVFYFEVIEATTKNKIKSWYYEGKDKFSYSEDSELHNGYDVCKVLFDLLENNYKVRAITKDGAEYRFNNKIEFLQYAYSLK